MIITVRYIVHFGDENMDTTFLSDEVINSTELRNNQKKWLDKAYVTPVSIVSGDKKLVILNRDHARQIFSLAHYADMIIRFFLVETEYLTKEEREEFQAEATLTFEKAAESKDWSAFEELLEDWKATANVDANPKLAKALLAKEDKSTYVRADD